MLPDAADEKLGNFPEANKEQLLERMIELQLYAEESLR